jgi:hypothetical protein
MRPLVAVLLAGCAADSDAPAKQAAEPIPTTLTIFERLHDRAGPIAGMPGYSIVHRSDATHCGGVAVEVWQRAGIANDDVALASVLELKFPTGLDFSERKKDASLKTFNAWVEHMRSTGAVARGFYSQLIQDQKSTIQDRLEASARIVQVQRHLASTIVRAEIPLDVRSGDYAAEKTEAFCEQLASVAEPIVLTAEGAAKVCAEHAAAAQPGWWSNVCVLTRRATASVDPSPSR